MIKPDMVTHGFTDNINATHYSIQTLKIVALVFVIKEINKISILNFNYYILCIKMKYFNKIY